jgi:hypothetical protein
VPRRRQHQRRILPEDHLNVGSRTGGAHITYWTGEGDDVANVRPVGDDDRVAGTFFHEGGLVHQHVIVRDDASAPVAEIERDTASLDRRVLVAAPLVCHLIGRPKRHFGPDSAIGRIAPHRRTAGPAAP